MNAVELPLEGACLCGAVQIRVTAQPLLTFACHCRDCQKLSASAYSLSAMFPANGVSVTGALQSGGLGDTARRHSFCASCLNFIHSQIEGAEHRINLRVGLFEDLSWFAPYVELMTDGKQNWANVPAQHSFARAPETGEQLAMLMQGYADQLHRS